MFAEYAARWEDGEDGADDVGCCWDGEVASVVLVETISWRPHTSFAFGLLSTYDRNNAVRLQQVIQTRQKFRSE